MLSPNSEDFTYCPNCGAELQDTLIDSIKECHYCGDKISTDVGMAGKQKAGIAELKIKKDQLSPYFSKWFANPVTQPEDVWDKIKIESATVSYYPAFLYKGSYKGEWRISERSKQGNGILDKKITQLSYAATLQSFMQSNNVNKAVSATLQADANFGLNDSEAIDNICIVKAVNNCALKDADISVLESYNKPSVDIYDFGMSEDASWRTYGKNALEEDMDKDIRLFGKNNNLPLDDEALNFAKRYKETVSSKQRVYIPIWEIAFTVDGSKRHYVAIDGVSGKAFGKNMEFKAPRPRAKTKYNLSGKILLWVYLIWGVTRSLLEKTSFHNFWNGSNYYDNILISPVMQKYWFIRLGLVVALYAFGASLIETPIRKKLDEEHDRSLFQRKMATSIDYEMGRKKLQF